MTKRTQEDYVPPKGVKTFSGSGHRLGAPVPDVGILGGAPSMPGTFPPAGSSLSPSAPPDTRERGEILTKFEVDQTQPTTSIQIRLADGTRSVFLLKKIP